jgi:hypothetical protein
MTLSQSKLRQLALSIAIVSLILSTNMCLLTAGALTTTGNAISKSITMTAGADGRAFTLINGTYGLTAVETIDHNASFTRYILPYSNIPSSLNYLGAGSKVSMVLLPHGFDPQLYPITLSQGLSIPQFIMTRNYSSTQVSPTYTLSAKGNITLGFNSTTEIQVSALNVVLATLNITSAENQRLVALTGNCTGATVNYYVFDPRNNLVSDGSINPATGPCFAFPFLVNMNGSYSVRFRSTGSSYVKLVPILVKPTSLTIGEFATGEIKVPHNVDNLQVIPNYEPVKIVAVSYDVSPGQEYAFSLSLGSVKTPTATYSCRYFDVASDQYGVPVSGVLTNGQQPVVYKAPIAGKVYIVLTGSSFSWFDYSIGVDEATISTATLNAPFRVDLPTDLGMTTQMYKFNLTSESMVRLNYTLATYAPTLYSQILKYTPDGTLYKTQRLAIGTGSIASPPYSWLRPGATENNPEYALHLDAGEYILNFSMNTGTPGALVEVNTYPIHNYSSGTSFDLSVHGSIALAINASQEFDFYAFNVTLLSADNVSMQYKTVLIDDYNRFINAFYGNGTVLARAGIGNKEVNGVWQGTPPTGWYTRYVDPTGQPAFSGNKSSQISPFISSYAGRYFLILDCLQTYNTTTDGTVGAHWAIYKDATVTLKIDLSRADLTAHNDFQRVTLNSSSGTGSTSVNLKNGSLSDLIFLVLTTKVNTWTRISISIVNGTSSANPHPALTRQSSRYEYVYDRIRYTYQGTQTFDPGNSLGILKPVYTEVAFGSYYNTTYVIEFGALRPTMMISFLIDVPSGATGGLVTFSVNHYNTSAFSGLAPIAHAAPSAGAGAFLLEIGLIVGVAVAAALVVIFIVVKKKSGGPH